MRQCGWSVRKIAMCMVNTQYMLVQHSPWNQAIASQRNVAVARQTEETYLPTVFVVSVGCSAGLCYSATSASLVPHPLEMKGG